MIMRRGDTGDQVKGLQVALGVTADGVFGGETEAAVRVVQDAHGLQVDGLAGPDTLAALHLIGVPDDTCTPGEIPAVLADRIVKARSWRSRGILYRNGCGGWHPDGDPADASGHLDCSGWAAWLIGIKRGPLPDAPPAWIETSQIFADAKGRRRRFREIARPVPGCFAVYADHDGHQGHIGLVTSTAGGVLRGIDCSSSRSDKIGQAITERGFEFFRAEGAIFVLLVTDPDCDAGNA